MRYRLVLRVESLVTVGQTRKDSEVICRLFDGLVGSGWMATRRHISAIEVMSRSWGRKVSSQPVDVLEFGDVFPNRALLRSVIELSTLSLLPLSITGRWMIEYKHCRP